MTIVTCPSFATVEDAIEYMLLRGCKTFYLHRGPDGLIRGNGVRE